MYLTKKIGNHIHVMKLSNRPETTQNGGSGKIIKVPQPNYLGQSGMVLCGILKPNESLEDWIKRNHKK